MNTSSHVFPPRSRPTSRQPGLRRGRARRVTGAGDQRAADDVDHLRHPKGGKLRWGVAVGTWWPVNFSPGMSLLFKRPFKKGGMIW